MPTRPLLTPRVARRARSLTLALAAPGLSGLARAHAAQDATAQDATTRGAAASVAVRMLGEGVLSTPDYEGSATLAPDGRTVYFAKRPPVGYFSVVCVSRLVDGRWTEPEIVEFSGRATDVDPFVSPDGRRLFFASSRTATGGTKSDFDIWFVERDGDAWSEPHPLGPPVNGTGDELHPTVDRAGTLYFASNRAGSVGIDIYRADPAGGTYGEPMRLDSTINARPTDTHPAVAPDGRTLVFVSVGRAEESLYTGMPYVRGDLYVSVRGPAGWSTPRRLPDGVNSPAAELAPAFSPDGARLLFTSERGFATLPFGRRVTYREHAAGLRGVENGLGNLYEVDARVAGVAP